MNSARAMPAATRRPGLLGQQHRRAAVLNFLTYVALFLLLIVVVFPLFWMVVTSFKPLSEVRRFPPTILPETFTFENYGEVFRQYPFGNFLFNSFFISIMGTLGAIFSCTLAGFALARLNFPGRRILFVVTLATLMIPYPARMVPLFVGMSRVGWIDTYLPLIVPWWFGSAYGVFLMRQFFKGIPGELMEAAILDGCNPLTVMLRIYLPLSMPALTALSVVTFTTIWNDFIPPLIFINTMEKMPVAVGLAFFKGQGEAIWSWLMAASVLSALPLLVLYVFAQRYIIESMAMTGLKR
jgi:multiple sugar transport system permease protein